VTPPFRGIMCRKRTFKSVPITFSFCLSFSLSSLISTPSLSKQSFNFVFLWIWSLFFNYIWFLFFLLLLFFVFFFIIFLIYFIFQYHSLLYYYIQFLYQIWSLFSLLLFFCFFIIFLTYFIFQFHSLIVLFYLFLCKIWSSFFWLFFLKFWMIESFSSWFLQVCIL